MKTFVMLIRRELWEHRVLWITPLVIAALLLVSTTVLHARLCASGDGFFAFNMGNELICGGAPAAGAAPVPRSAFTFIGAISVDAIFMIAAALVAVMYLLDCLYAERRDRSILFWKSLPVSDRATVLAKFAVGIVVVPFGYFVAAAIVSLADTALLAWRGAAILGAGLPGWDAGAWARSQGLVLYATGATVLWYLPYAAYFLLVSAWARRSLYVWAFLPPVILSLAERLLFGTNDLGRLVARGFAELFGIAFRLNRELVLTLGGDARGPRPPLPPGGPGGRAGSGRLFDFVPDPAQLLASPLLWLGIGAAAAMVWVAITLRRRGDEG